MLKRLRPCFQVETVLKLTPDFFFARGLKGMIIDLDNTLVAWGEDLITPETERWIEALLASGLKVCILSNALEQRVREIGTRLNIPWVSRAIKPRKHPFRKAMEIMGTSPQETAVVGDQLFTDVFGGNRMALYTIWTTPLSAKELFSTKAVRRLERMVVKRFQKKNQ